jgi:CO dehydrogenase maturation factor
MLSVLLAKALAVRGYNPLLIDADESNMGLRNMLGIEKEPKPLMEYLGGKPEISKKMRAAFSSGSGEPQMTILPQTEVKLTDIPPEFIAGIDHIRLLAIGKIEHTMEGCACPMGALARDLLAKLSLGERDVVITDHEAGIEHFGRGVEKGVEAVIIIVEPSYESVLLAEKINQLAASVNARAVVVLNKMTPETEEAMRAELKKKGISVDCVISYDPDVFKACLSGQPLSGLQAEKEVAALVETLGL